MSWLIEEQPDQRQLAAEFRKLVAAGPIVRIPGTHDGMSARIAKLYHFGAIYLSGAAYTASRGLPDLGLIYSNEIADRARDLVRASGLPLLVDIDTGFGGVLNVARTAKEMVEAKVAAIQTEDQEMPISRTGTQQGSLDSMQTRKQLYDTIRYYDYEALDRKIEKTILPEPPPK